MAEENQASPISEAQPPKADPTAKPVAEGVKTLKLNPVVRKPVAGATQSALRPGLKLPSKTGLPSGLKLPPKTGATVSALRPGLKLPPKPGIAGATGATQSALKPGLKLPPKPGLPGSTQSALKPGLKLPPKPVIRKPGETVSAAPVPKPVAVDAQGVGKLPTVDAKAVPRDDTAPAASDAPKPMEALKSVTQKLKGITQQIPAQAILRKTGIISDAAMSDSQKQAAKSKTARISLSDAMGVAPVKNESAPMKTIRIKRPIDIPGATKPLAPQPPSGAAGAPAPVPAAVDAAVPPMPTEERDAKTVELSPTAVTNPPAEAPATATAAASPTVTQRKTLKITRPGATGVRPAGKFGVKRPGMKTSVSQAATKASDKPAAGTDAAVADIADIPDIPDIPSTPAAPVQQAAVSDVPGWASALGVIVELAASVAVAALAWFLYQDFQLPLYCGGCM